MKNTKKGQATTIAFLFILIIFIAMVTVINAVEVPSEEERKEISHAKSVNSQLIGISSNIGKVSSTGRKSSSSVDLGVTYEDGFILDSTFPRIHGLDPSGTLTINETGKYILQGKGGDPNFRLSKNQNIRPNGVNFKKSFTTSRIKYSIDYNQIGKNNRIIEGLFNYKTNDNSPQSVLRKSSIISGNKINIVSLRGDFREKSTGTEQVDIIPISTGDSTVEVFNLKALHIPTKIEHDNRIFKRMEKKTNVAQITDSSMLKDGVEVGLKPGTSYILDVSVVGLRTRSTSIQEDDPKLRYKLISPGSLRYEENETIRRTIKVEAFDENYNRIGRTKGKFDPRQPGNFIKGGGVRTTDPKGRARATWRYEDAGSDGVIKFNWNRP